VATGPTLGPGRDTEADGTPSANADGDDVTDTDDEDGVTFGTFLFTTVASATGVVTVDLQNPDAAANYLDAWLDFNRDGDWDDAGEQIFASFDLGTAAGSQDLDFTIPAGVAEGTTYARFRLSTAGGLDPAGLAGDGEVEDYLVEFVNVAPSAPTDGDSTADRVAEGAVAGTPVGITVSASDPNGQGVAFTLSDDAGGRFQIDSGTGLVTVRDGSLLDFETATSHAIVVQASDGTLTSSQSFTIDVSNVNEAPVLSVPGSLSVAPASKAVFTITASDPDALDLEVRLSVEHGALTLGSTAGLSFIQGDGAADTEMTFTGSLADITAALAGVSYQPIAGYIGPDSIRVTANDRGQTGVGTALEAAATVAVTVGSYGSAQMQPDAWNPGKTALVIFGTENSDTISIVPVLFSSKVTVWINGKYRGVFAPTGRIVVYGFGGHDRIIASSVGQDMLLDGGTGNDILKSGRGHDVLLGGAGRDLLAGNWGRDLMIGGQGSDVLLGGAGEDILIAGGTVHDDDAAALGAIMREWTSSDPFSIRKADLAAMLHSLTVFRDTVDNYLAGGLGPDWYLSERLPNGKWR
jgi:Ca2+-binding RTX toxin-like protein